MDKNQYLDMFIDESTEHLQAINDNLLRLEKNPQDLTIIDEVFRSAHTLKGMAATMGFEDLTNLTHHMENVLDGIRNEKIEAGSNVLDIVFDSVDDLEQMVTDVATGGEGRRDVSAIVGRLGRLEQKQPEAVPEFETLTFDEYETAVVEQGREQGFIPYQVFISLSENVVLKAARVFMVFEALEKHGEVIKSIPAAEQLEEEAFDFDFQAVVLSAHTAEEIQSAVLKVSEVASVICAEAEMQKPVIQERVPETEENDSADEERSADPVKQAPAGKTIRVNIDRLDSLMNLFEELVIDRGRLEQIAKDLGSSDLTETVEHMTRISGDLQSIILNMRMVPVEQVFNRFPRMIRGLSKELGKQVELVISGAETELDRTVIDEIGDPLVHLLRNSIDHGIESPSEREAAGKPAAGTVRLHAYHSGNHVFIEVSDDGAGIHKQKVLQKAITGGVVSEEAANQLTDKQIYELLFSSGLSTAEKLSDISGRGVGLDVVKNKIETLGGTVAIDSTLGEGTVFSVQLPLTLSIISVMLVEVQHEKYAVPLSSIIETAIIKREDIWSVQQQKVIDFRGHVVPLLDLTEFFQVPVTEEKTEELSVIIVRKGDKMAALVVHRFIGQQEIVLKSLGDYLKNTKAVSGATILGDGQVALIIDCNALIQ
ncbi:chemotaxis protein CheW [Bacillus daqingensis]|uniref:Chemotaxis protein CheA n=1 Tax=Bacillus daqingensis TaxID=872396 RepID=A0ABV9NSF2_9BACI